MKDYQQCIEEAGRSLGWLPPTHPSTQIPLSFAEKAAQLYASECVKEAVKMARQGYLETDSIVKYTEQEILSKLNL